MLLNARLLSNKKGADTQRLLADPHWKIYCLPAASTIVFSSPR